MKSQRSTLRQSHQQHEINKETPLTGGENNGNGNNEQQKELESIIKDLEEENTFLIEEYTRLQHQLARNAKNGRSQQQVQGARRPHMTDYNGSGIVPGAGYHSVRALSSSPTPMQAAQRGSSVANYCTYLGGRNQPASNGSLNGAHYHPHQHHMGSMTLNSYNRVPLLFKSTASSSGHHSQSHHRHHQTSHHHNEQHLSLSSSLASKCDKESEILKEARLLRQHEDKLEARMKILENHNRLLDSQLKQLKSLLNNVMNSF